MRLLLLVIGMLCCGIAFSQDSTRIKFDALKQSYQQGKLSFEQYQLEVEKLLKPDPKPEVKQEAVIPVAKFDTISVPRTEEYCMLIATGKMFSNKVSIDLDYGQKRSFFADKRVRDSGGKLVEFESVIDALNFMNSKGWELYAAYPMVSNAGTAYHYLLKRKVLDK
jgi:hypothetical protein